jgi:peroxiredoxin
MNSTTLINFLKKSYVEDVFNSHVSLIDPKGNIVKEYLGVNPITHVKQITDDLKQLTN